MNEIEQHVFAYYLANGAQVLNMVGRFWPYGELTMMIEDKIRVDVRKFGTKAGGASLNAARALQDVLIERGAFSTTKNKFGGTMHQFQADVYPKVLKELQAENAVLQKAQGAGGGFWEEAFAAVT